jgi:opacity protein-like surface antigen
MKTALTSVVAAAAILAAAGGAQAQTYVTPATTASIGETTPLVGGYGAYGFGSHASTYEEGVLAGWGTLARSVGEANYFHSLASINYQEAYTRFLQNRQHATETYFRMQQINRAARDAQRSPRLSYEQYVALAKKYAPDGLDEQQYDRTLGRLSWPAALLTDDFAAEREALDRAFLVRSPADAGTASAFYSNVWRLATMMEARLQSKIELMNPAEYLAAKKFLTGLAYESQQPLVVRAVAAR